MGAIYKRELKAYFYSPLGYIFLAIMYFFSSQFFVTILAQGSAYITYVFQSMFSIVIIFIPLLTMRLMSEDKKIKTDQLLFTAPVNVSGVVLGKYFAALTVYLMGIASTILYVIIIAAFTTPEWNIFLGNFLALFLLGAAVIAIGLLVSSFTENQMIAAIVTFAIMLFIFMFDGLAQSIPTTVAGNTFLAPVLSFFAKILKQVMIGMSFMSRYSDFAGGVLNISHVIFFVSIVVAFNYLTIRVIERKRWS